MNKLKSNILYYVILVLDFYVLPYLIKDTGSAMPFRKR